MATKEALLLYLNSLDRKTYYDVLRASRDADAAGIKAAFHAFALLYHPDQYVASQKDVSAVASEIFKRGVEAYGVLSRRATRERYDRALARGKIRLEPWHPSTRPPPPMIRTLAMIAQTPNAQWLAETADRLIALGRLGDARRDLAKACKAEPGNTELAERLQFLDEALALEPS
jgi:curved DNA-binding protein CbpA